MGNWKIWQNKSGKKVVIETFHILTITILSLLLPLSFLLLARLSTANYLFFTSQTPQQPLRLSLFLYTNPTLLHLLLSLVCVSTLIHAFASQFRLFINTEEYSLSTHTAHVPPITTFGPRLYSAWVFLCTLQVCVGLGIEGSIAAGIDASQIIVGNHQTSFVRRIVFFLGLHETMIHWWRMVVKPVVDDTVYGFPREERWFERVIMACSFGGLWWWRLRDEVESLVVVAELKRELLMGVGVADFIECWLYYLTISIGMVKVVNSILCLGFMLVSFCKKRPVVHHHHSHSHIFIHFQEKV